MGVLNIWVIAHGEFQLIALQLLHFAMTFEVAPLCQSGVWKKASGDAGKVLKSEQIAFDNSVAQCPIAIVPGGSPGTMDGFSEIGGYLLGNPIHSVTAFQFIGGVLYAYGPKFSGGAAWRPLGTYVAGSGYTAGNFILGTNWTAVGWFGASGMGSNHSIEATPAGIMVSWYMSDSVTGQLHLVTTLCPWTS